MHSHCWFSDAHKTMTLCGQNVELLNVKLVVRIVTTEYRKNERFLILYSLYGGGNFVFSVNVCSAACVLSTDSQSCAQALFDRISVRLSLSVLACNYLVPLYKWWCSILMHQTTAASELQPLFPHKGTCSEFMMSRNVCSCWHSQWC